MAIAYVQHKSADGTAASQTVVLDSAPTAGNVHVLWATRREGTGATFTPDGSGWSLIQRTSCAGSDSWPVEMHYRVVPGGASATIVCSGASDLVVAEFSGVGDFDTSAYSGVTNTAATVSITPAGSSNVLLVAGVAIKSDWGITLTPSTGMTGLVTGAFSGSGPYTAFAYRIVTGTSGAYTVGFTGNDGSDRAVVAASLLEGGGGGGATPRSQAIFIG